MNFDHPETINIPCYEYEHHECIKSVERVRSLVDHWDIWCKSGMGVNFDGRVIVEQLRKALEGN